MEFLHEPVLLQSCIEGLAIRPEGTYVDCTVGGGGHSVEIARKLTSGRLIGIDQDAEAIEAAKQRLADFKDKVLLFHSNFSELGHILDAAGADKPDGFLFDLGVSSHQLDDAERGFSYRQDAPLDMRMDQSQGVTAAVLVNSLEPEALAKIFFDYGEERYARKIAAAIALYREQTPIQTTLELAEIIKKAMPPAALREKQHPAKRTFQALRIAVNGELDVLEQSIRDAIKRCAPGGRICVITFHSLEDRIVKRTFAEAAKGCICPPSFPVCICGIKPSVKLLVKGSDVPEEEIRKNPRARSARLRIAEKI